jgi:uncharacterized OsmC-like protein
VFVIRRIHVRYRLKADPAHRETSQRVLAFHADHCPVARSIGGCIAILTSLEMENS